MAGQDDRPGAVEQDVQPVPIEAGLKAGNHALAACAPLPGPAVDAHDCAARVAAGAWESGFVPVGHSGVTEGTDFRSLTLG